ncbi:hypothetical protein IF2G_09059 [Cordyceps javanica]|nr:hypothetical protein IF2G_09059 [Cordyceps javanica]
MCGIVVPIVIVSTNRPTYDRIDGGRGRECGKRWATTSVQPSPQGAEMRIARVLVGSQPLLS